MIDFTNTSFVKLREVLQEDGFVMISDLLIDDKQIFNDFKGVRDVVIFTNYTIVAVNIQGITDKKKDFSSLPYSKVQAFFLESDGVFDLDAELESWFSRLGKVKFAFDSKFDVKSFSKFLSRCIL